MAAGIPAYDGTSPGATRWLPHVQQATRAVAGNQAYWQDLLSSTVHIGAFHAVTMSDEEKREFERYHAPLAFTAEGREPQKAPNLRLTVKGAAKGRVPMMLAHNAELPVVCKQTSCGADAERSVKQQATLQDLRMCETCFRVAHGMHSCNGCHHAWYCGTGCQRAAWESGHKRRCKSIAATLEARGIQPAPGVFQVPVCIGIVMQPDRPQLCRFWLAGLVSALAAAAPIDYHLALGPLVAFLWRFTFAAVPKPLRGDLVAAAYAARATLAEKTDALRDAAMRGEMLPEMEFVSTATMICHALIRVIERDDVFRVWRRVAQGRAARLPRSPLGAEMTQYLDAALGTIIQGALMSQDAMVWGPGEHPGIDARTARFAVGSVLRGTGLLTSAFGLLVAGKTHAAIVEHLAALVNKLPKSFGELDEELVHCYQVGWLDPERKYVPPAVRAERSDPRHLIVEDPRRLRCNGVQLGRDAEVAEMVAELWAAGARALPLVPATLPGEGERRFMEQWNDMLVDPAACGACCERRWALLVERGGACEAMAARDDLQVKPLNAPDLPLV